MKKLSREDLLSLEEYDQQRAAFRKRVRAHKKARQVALGDHATFYFEDRLTIQYQIQEMLRAERIFESAGIREELDAYNPLIPDGSNWKATFMIEYADAVERRAALSKLVGIEDKVWAQVADFAKVMAIADEDLERSTDDKTSAVHFLRFELDTPMVDAVKNGAGIRLGSDHANYPGELLLSAASRDSLAADLD